MNVLNVALKSVLFQADRYNWRASSKVGTVVLFAIVWFCKAFPCSTLGSCSWPTTTVPAMFGCKAQKYGYSPASSKVWLNVWPGFSRGLKFGEESNLPSGIPADPDVTVCTVESSLVQITVSPTLT